MKNNLLKLFLLTTILFTAMSHAQKVKVLVFGDSQKIMNEDPNSFLTSMDKLLIDTHTNDANFILQMGDIVEDNLDSNWPIAQEGWLKIDNKIPYVLNVGNNDLVNDPTANKFNQYFPLSHYQAWPSFVSNFDRHTNVAHRFNLGGVNWLIISLRYAANASVLAWAEGVITSNPTNKVLMISHDANLTSSVTQLGLKYANVVAVLAGHTATSDPAVLTGTQGNKMLYLKTCFHNKLLDMYSCVLEFDVNAGSVSGRYYSAQYGKYWDDPTAPGYGDSKMPTQLVWSASGFNFKNSIDLCPYDPNKVEPGICGCGIAEGTCTDTPNPPNSIVLQAEDAVFSGPVIATNQPNYHGTGFLDFTNASGDYIKWTANIAIAGSYTLKFRYALASGNRPLKLTINGVVAIPSITFIPTGSFAVWGNYTTNQYLNTGNNEITLTSIGSNGGNFDELVIFNPQDLGVNDLKTVKQEKSLLISPNPYKQGLLTIDITGFEMLSDIRIKINNLKGQLIYQELLKNKSQLKLDLSGKLNESVYFISIESGSTKLTKKFIVN
jgi:hypothetical protein